MFLAYGEVPIYDPLRELLLRQTIFDQKDGRFGSSERGARAADDERPVLASRRLPKIDPWRRLGDAFGRLLDPPALRAHVLTPSTWRSAVEAGDGLTKSTGR